MTTFPAAVTDAIAYVSAQDVEVPPDVWALAVQSGALKATGDLAAINAQYHDAVTESLITYLEGGSLAASKNSFKRAMIEAFGGAWDAGWDGNPPTGDALEWLNARTQQELAFIDGLYVQAKELRKDPEADTFAWATARADGYTGTVDNIYNHARIRALGNKMLTFDGEDGSPDNICQSTNGTCVRLKGKRHRASWWIAHDLVPYRGNPNYDCGAWECRHYLKDDKGERYTFGGGSQAVKHEGPGNHPGTGSPQTVHAGNDYSQEQTNKVLAQRAEVEARIAQIKKDIAENPTRYESMGDEQLLDVRDNFNNKLNRMEKYGVDKLTPSELEEYNKAVARRERIRLEISRRRELASRERQLKQVEQSIETGIITVSETEMRGLLAKPGDAYRDVGYAGEYNPDIMLTSDLSGMRIRHYIRLPDGRLAHPDELIEARRRGRVIVVEEATLRITK
jgi:hypothetical protein